ncbi:MAG: MFS transporter [Bacteroidales bacterium]
MKINTGRGTISLFTLLAVWSISAVTSLPGLAISPILGKLDTIFPKVSHMEIDMLTSLPSLLIIPFILLSGRIADSGGKIKLVVIGLSIYLLSAVLYFFADSMFWLILIGCLLGAGAGIVIPLSTSLIATIFEGKYRVSQLGISSSITNVTLVVATFVAGILADVNWHLPFIVYMLPLASLLLILKANKKSELKDSIRAGEVPSSDSAPDEPAVKGIKPKNVMRLVGIYFFITYMVLTVTFNLPYLMQAEKMDSSASGTMISILFLAIMLPGLFLNKVIGVLKNNTNIVGSIFIFSGLIVIYFSTNVFLITLGCVLTGLGYGAMQPIVYEKASDISTRKTTTLILGIVMSMNYLAILLFPVIIQALQDIFHLTTSRDSFLVNAILGVLFSVLLYFSRNTFSVGMDKRYYTDNK